jgi:hypothetical protein
VGNAENCSPDPRFFRNDGPRGELAPDAYWREPACIISKESIMRNKILAIAAVAGAMSSPIAAQAQTVIIDHDLDGIAVEERPAFREYIVRERVPNYTIPDRVVVGGVLPEVGVTYYDVPQTFGAMPYRYTVVNGRTILVEPRSRRIVQVIE